VSLCTSHGFCLLLVIVAVTVCLVAIFILSLSDDAFFLFSRVLFLHSDIILVTFFHMECMVCVCCTRTRSGLNLHLETRRARAARGGMGSVKCAGNYGAALKPLMDCKQHGFHDNVFLELETLHSASSNSGSNSGSSSNGAIGKAVLQEMSAANLFLVLKTGEIVTPSLDRGTILPGITRSSVLALIEEYADELQPYMMQSLAALNYKDSDKNAVLVTVRASSRDVTVEECLQATEAFCTGTAAELVPIYRLATGPDDDKAFQFEVEFPHGKSLPGGPVTVALLAMLREAMVGKRDIAKKQGWLRDPYAPAQEFMS
jgi:branched-chain amino acid aminotransferase